MLKSPLTSVLKVNLKFGTKIAAQTFLSNSHENFKKCQNFSTYLKGAHVIKGIFTQSVDKVPAHIEDRQVIQVLHGIIGNAYKFVTIQMELFKEDLFGKQALR